MSAAPGADFDAALVAVMGDLARGIDALHACLIEERLALDNPDPQPLEDVGRAKGDLIDRVEALDVELRQLGDAARVDAFADPRWTHVFDRLRECRQLNETNGRIVGQRISHVRHALSLISGDSPGGSTYGRNGVAKINLRSATLAQV
ncbi:FlgN protein [Luteibacter sp. UNCMF331Sha3.1]|uniref:flagella synthesis protein FlgN n=1 Tax=Luteibacter sp. UNCMF331Sha3.1 TaxID=1502760 RepID=UPI0008CB49ED|nr:flagellar protein FlgN [Luteibacter sp. UNCMF331Sha3.1]SEM28215.1 FlgN protein [Luteibacter sp. UNCMF331Sha3.1]